MGHGQESWDVILVGGGLHNCLTAAALLHHHPRIRLLLCEREPRLGGQHTWCFHAADVPEAARPWFAPLQAFSWPDYEVRFPGHVRVVKQAYAGFDSQGLHRHLQRLFGEAPRARLMLDCGAQVLGPRQVLLDDGRRLQAGLVLDGRGDSTGEAQSKGWQVFCGWELELARPCQLARPLVMDATVEQRGGYRFMYVLPFSPRRLLIEDTRFSSSPHLDPQEFKRGMRDYMHRRGWKLGQIIREEQGCLPMPAGPPAPAWQDQILRSGMRGGWFHPGTGYSTPLALAFAQTLAEHFPAGAEEALRTLRRELEPVQVFAARLNAMFFSLPAQLRWRILRRFYHLPEDLISRFYALRSTGADQARILFDRPPGLPWFRLPRTLLEGRPE